MTGFSATDAALEGFRITRERPRTLAAWAVFSFLVSAAGAAITLYMPRETRAALETIGRESAPDPEVVLQALAVLSPILLFGLAVQCVMAAAVYRILLRPQGDRFHYLRLGSNELRLMALTLIYLVLAVVLLAAAQLAVTLLTLAVSPFGAGAMGVAAGFGEVIALGSLIFLAVRMSLAPVITFDQARLALADSWALTRGQFWRLAGTYLLTGCCLVVMAILALMLFVLAAGAFVVAAGGELADVGEILAPSETSLNTYLSPLMIAYMAMGSLFTAIYYAVIAAPGAFAYRALRDAGAA